MAAHHRKNMVNALQRLMDAVIEYQRFEPLLIQEKQSMLEVHAVLTECKQRIREIVSRVAGYPKPDIPVTRKIQPKFSWVEHDESVQRRRVVDPEVALKKKLEDLERQLELLDKEE